VQLLRKYSRDHSTKFDVQLGKDHFESFLMLESGRAQAFVLDANLLAGVIANSKNPTGYKIVGEVLGPSPLRCCSATAMPVQEGRGWRHRRADAKRRNGQAL
jgi:ABC-type amino acid transport substrate-binding protein